MGAVADVVGGALESVFEPIKQVGQIAESALREIGHAAESVGREAQKIGQAAVNDPIGTIAKVAAVATQQYWALPLISAADVMAHGGNLEQAAIAAGVSYAAQGIASGVSDYLGAGATGGVQMATEDAANLTAQGLSSQQVSEILQQSYNLAPEIANNITAQTILGNTASEITKDITSQMATQNLLANAAGNTVGGASRVALSGGDLNQVLMGGVTSGAGSLAGGYTTQELKDMGVNGSVANIIGKSTGAAIASTIAGKDAKLSFINAMINTTLAESGKQVGSELKSVWKSANDAATSFNDKLTKAQEDYKTKLTPLETDAKAAQETAATSYDAYKSVKDKFDGIVADYNKAKDAGDSEKANNLADQANALLPQLNDATNKYNGDATNFDTKLATYNSAADDYKKQTDAIAAAKTEYDTRAADLQKTTKDFTETALKVADMGDNAKTAFQKLYDNGTKLNDSFDTAKTLDTLQPPAQDTFLRRYDQTNDLTSSLEFAQKVNSLDKNSISAYDAAIKTGLDDESALKIAPDMSGLGETGRNVYLDSLKNGDSQQSATIAATLANIYADQNPVSTESPYAPVASNTTGPVTDVGGPTTPLVPTGKVTVSAPDQAFDENAPAIPIPPAEEEQPVSEEPDGSYIPPIDLNVDNKNVGNGENPDPNYVAPQVPSETIGTGTAPSTGTGTDTTKVPTPTVSTPTVSTPTVNVPVTPWTLPATTTPAITTPTVGGAAPASSNLLQQDTTGGIKNLTPGLTQKMDYTLTGIPNIQETTNPVPGFAAGSSVASDPFSTGLGGTNSDGSTSISNSLSPGLTKAQLNYILTGLPGNSFQSHAEGGSIEDHNPSFFSEGGLGSMENRYVEGGGDGTSDSVAAMLANGEFVIPADVVSKLGNGSNEAGAGVLDQFLKVVRKDANSNGEELPPDSKGPLAYLAEAKQKMKA